jgi:hypothetical protein
VRSGRQRAIMHAGDLASQDVVQRHRRRLRRTEREAERCEAARRVGRGRQRERYLANDGLRGGDQPRGRCEYVQPAMPVVDVESGCVLIRGGPPALNRPGFA